MFRPPGYTRMRPFILAVAAVAVLAGCRRPAAGAPSAIAWVTDYDQALAQAKAAGKPLMVYFTMDG